MFYTMSEPKKRIFIGLIVFTVLLITAITVGLYLIPYIGLKNIHPLAPQIVCFTMGVVLGILILGVGLLILTLIRGREIFFAARLRGIVIEVLFPIMIVLGKLLGISKEKVQQSFVEVNNLLVKAKCGESKPKRILLLMPHCLQFNDCAIKVTSDASKCQACGKCKIKDLVELAQKVRRPPLRGHRRHAGPAAGGGGEAGSDHRRCLRAGPDERHPGRLPPARDRHPERPSLRPLLQHQRGHQQGRRSARIPRRRQVCCP